MVQHHAINSKSTKKSNGSVIGANSIIQDKKTLLHEVLAKDYSRGGNQTDYTNT